MAKKKVVIVGVGRPEDQARYQHTLKGLRVSFVETHEDAIKTLNTADVLAVHLDKESVVSEAVKRSFPGRIVPIMAGKKQSVKVHDGKTQQAYSCRDAPKIILSLLGLAVPA